MKYFFAIVSCILLFASCESESSTTPAMARRTVIVYMAAENNLSSLAKDDILEMIAGASTLPDDCRLLVFVDRSSTVEKPFIIRISNNSRQPVDTLFKYQQDFLTSDRDNFSDVLLKAISLSPSQEYGLVLWGHADGWIIENAIQQAPRRAYGRDNGENSYVNAGSWLDIPDMVQALKSIGRHWKFIFSDCCNMQGVETAYELRSIADYLIASPAEITGKGAPYDVILKDFFLSDDEQMCQSLCDDYHASLDYVGGHLPISAVSTAGMDLLLKATQDILPELRSYIASADSVYDLGKTTLSGKIYYFSYDKSNRNDRLMYDMNDIVRSALADAPEKYALWRQAFDGAVVYRCNSTMWHANTIYLSTISVTDDYSDRQGCISMFFPLKQYQQTYYKYNSLITQMEWFQKLGW